MAKKIPAGAVTVNLTEAISVQPIGQAKPQTQKVSANPLREYVSGGGWGWAQSASFLRSLPFYIDDLSRELGDDIYERMQIDPQVSSDIETMKLGIMAQGVTLHPAVSNIDADDYERACEIKTFCQRVLDGLQTPLGPVLMDMLDAIATGYRVAEIVYDIPATGPLAGYLVPVRIKPKPRRAVAFVVDPMNNIKGILGEVPGTYSPLLVESVLLDASAPNLLPRSKFAILTYMSKNGDPRGQSLLRAAYTPWWLKQQGYPGYLKYLAAFAVPSIIGFTPAEAVEETQFDADGNPLMDSEGNLRTITAEQAMLAGLQRFQNGTAAAFKNGSSVEPFEVKDGVGPYEAFKAGCNREISTAITGQTLASQEGEHQARAAAEVHQDVAGLRAAYGNQLVAHMVRQDILREVVRLNFSDEEAALLTPRVSMGSTEPQDFADVAGAVADLWEKEYLSPSQISALDAKLGLPARTKEEMAAIQEGMS